MPRAVFLSYSQADRSCAFEITEHLEAAGLQVWIAPRDVSPSADWAKEIIDAISAAQVMVLVFSSSSNSSPQVRREVERAVHKQLRILPVRIEPVVPVGSLEYFLSAQHWLDAYPPPREPHYARLCSHLRSLLSEPPAQLHAGDTATAPEALAPAIPAPPPNAPSLPEPELQRLTLDLAQLIGPVARVLVDRAARTAANIDELIGRLAAELESTEDQRRFLQSCARFRRC